MARTSAASSSPRRVGLAPTMTAPASAAPARRNKYSGVFSIKTPTWNGPSSRRARRSSARRWASLTTWRQVHRCTFKEEAGAVVFSTKTNQAACCGHGVNPSRSRVAKRSRIGFCSRGSNTGLPAS